MRKSVEPQYWYRPYDNFCGGSQFLRLGNSTSNTRITVLAFNFLGDGLRDTLKGKRNEILGLIGETGCGKSILGRAINGVAFRKCESWRKGREIAMMLQNPSTSLNPVLTVGEQIAEVYRSHNGATREEAKRKASNMLELVGVDSKRMCEYPHQFSGEMKHML